VAVAVLLAVGPAHAAAPESVDTLRAGAGSRAALATITMDFQDVEIGVLAKFISEVTGRNFIVDDRVSGTVTIIAPEKITPEEAYEVFQSVLQVKGFTTVAAGRATKIVPSKDVKETTVRTTTGPAPELSAEEYVTRLTHVRHVDAATVAHVLEPLVSRDGLIRAYPPANMLVLVDTAANVERLLTVVGSLDVDSKREQLAVVRLEHAAASELAPTLGMLVSQAAGDPDQPAGSRPTVVADQRTNSLVLRAHPAQLSQIRSLIADLDVRPAGEYATLHVYPLKYADAEAMVEVLAAFMGGHPSGAGRAGSRVAIGPRGGSVRFPAPQPGPSMAPGAEEAAEDGDQLAAPVELIGDVRVSGDPATNTLLISAAMQDFTALSAVIEQLDVPRPQVYVEAIILEVSVDRAQAMGFDFRGTAALGGATGLAALNLRDLGAAVTDPSSLSGLILAAASNDTVRLPDGTEVPAQVALFTALEQDKDINILSAPNILTTDNQEAEIVVGQNVPFITSRATDQANLDNLFATVERRDVGITLRLTPQITEGDTVHLIIYEEVSALEPLPDADAEVAALVGPVTRVRSASTSVLAGDGQTVVIGGLLSETTQRMERGVPYLSKIPFLGQLLRRTDTARIKTNLLIFLTPHILRTHRALQAESVRRRGRMAAALPPGSLTELEKRRLAEITRPEERDDAPPGDEPGPASDAEVESGRRAHADWEVQAAASQDRARAEAIVRELATKGYRAFILPSAAPASGWYRIRIGGLDSRAEAEALARDLLAQGIAGAFVPPQ
jgi:general secretion pathway protein D